MVFDNSQIQGIDIPFECDFNMALAIALKAIRLKKDIKQSHIYKELCIKSSTYNNIDKGAVTISVVMLRSIANYLKVSVAFIYQLAEHIHAYSNNPKYYPNNHTSLCYCA